MDDREHSEQPIVAPNDQSRDEGVLEGAPIMDLDVFESLIEVVHSHYLWRWNAADQDTRDAMMHIERNVIAAEHFRVVGDVEVEDDIFCFTLWMEASEVFSLARVDVMVLDALNIDLGRCALLARDLTRMGLEYHIVTFGDGRAQQFCVNIIGPRMQQIRDLGTLVTESIDSYSA